MSFWSSGLSKGILGLGASPIASGLIGGFGNIGPGSPASMGLQPFNPMKFNNTQAFNQPALGQGTGTGMFKSENIPMLTLWNNFKGD